MSTGESQQLLATIYLFDEAIYYLRHGDGGEAAACYEVSPSDLAAAFAGVAIATPLLPAGTLHWSRTDGRERIVIYIPPAVCQLIILETDDTRTRLTVPLPGLVFAGHDMKYHLWAVKARPSEASERLFAAPFPNVDGDQGSVCWGDTIPPAAKTTTVRTAWETFLAADFNNHWVNDCSQSEPRDVRALWRRLAAEEATEYPLDDLAKTHLKLGDVLR